MVKLTLERDVIEKRLNGIQGELAELESLASQEKQEFCEGFGYKLAQYHLHRALEGVFNISAHILARIPGAETTSYKEMALKLGEVGIVSSAYAKDVLVRMAGYRNRLVHFYAEVTPEEIHGIVHERLGDFDEFMRGVKEVLEHPETFRLEIE